MIPVYNCLIAVRLFCKRQIANRKGMHRTGLGNKASAHPIGDQLHVKTIPISVQKRCR